MSVTGIFILNILFFSRILLDELVTSLAEVGLTLNVKNTKILTTQAEPPQQLRTRGGTVDVADRRR